MTGFLKQLQGKQYCVLTSADGKCKSIVRQGQYLYLCVKNGWIPVRLSYSEESKRWYFENLDGVSVYGQFLMVK